jgi:thimet oligopeptidase
VLLYISPDSAVRDASQACSQQLTNFYVDVSADADLYAANVAIRQSGKVTDVAGRKLLDLNIESGRHAGAGLDSQTRVRTTALFKRLYDQQRDFSIGIAGDKSTITISAAEAKGVSPQLLGTLKANVDGGYTIPVNEATVSAFMRTEPLSETRSRYQSAYFARGGAANVARLDTALAIRDSLARLFGFANWAEYNLDTHMVKEPARVVKFLDDIAIHLADSARSYTNRLAALKRASGDMSPFGTHDAAFYSAQLRRTQYDVDPEAVRQYFPVDHVMSAVFDIYSQMLGVTFSEMDAADAWAPGVREFVVSDTKTQKPLGWVYFDLYPRPNKYNHFAVFPMRSATYWPDGSVIRPVIAMIGNWPTPEPGKPSLLSHGDVDTFFHEFGHLMAGILVHVPYPTLVGLRQDFVEAPSQMLENWMWQPEVLARVSKNVTTGKPLPKDLIDRMIALRRLGEAQGNAQQAFYASYDMRLHMTRGLETKATWDSLYKRIVPGPVLTGAYPAASFGHLMSGYDAGYYGYLWSKAYAQDLFTRFEKDGVLSPAAGMAYRTQILEPGGVREPDELLRMFLGRPLNYDAFYRDLGIVIRK